MCTDGAPPPLLLCQPDLTWIAPSAAMRLSGSKARGLREVIAVTEHSVPGPGICVANAYPTPGTVLLFDADVPPPGFRPLGSEAGAFLREGVEIPEHGAPDLDRLLTDLATCLDIAEHRFVGGGEIAVDLDPVVLLADPGPAQRQAVLKGQVEIGCQGVDLLLPLMPLAVLAWRIFCSGAGEPPIAAGFAAEREVGGPVLVAVGDLAQRDVCLTAQGPGWRIDRVVAVLSLPAAWVDKRPAVDPLAAFGADPFAQKERA
ncbi:MAG: hypothetical protein AAGI13_08525 [Pseudomonadota bacterium]